MRLCSFILIAGITMVQFWNPAEASGAKDGICKAEALPPNHLPVKEFNSSQCDSKDPLEKNAWEVDEVHSGMVACEKLDYENGHAPGISFVNCREVTTPNCPPHLDGGPNAFEIREPAECAKLTAVLGRRLQMQCVNQEQLRSGTYPEQLGNRGWIAFVRSDPQACPPQDSGPRTEASFADLQGRTGLVEYPFCVATNQSQLKRLRLSAVAEQIAEPRVLLVRRFFSTLCPPSPDNEPNAFVLRIVQPPTTEPVFACSDSLGRGSDSIPRSRGRGRTGIPATLPSVGSPANLSPTPVEPSWSIVRRFHDDKCGGGSAINAIQISYRQ